MNAVSIQVCSVGHAAAGLGCQIPAASAHTTSSVQVNSGRPLSFQQPIALQSNEHSAYARFVWSVALTSHLTLWALQRS